jgi:hypothetical protein
MVVAGNKISIGCSSLFLDHGPALNIVPLPRGDAGIKEQVKYRFPAFRLLCACGGKNAQDYSGVTKVSVRQSDSGSPLRLWALDLRYLTCPRLPLQKGFSFLGEIVGALLSAPRSLCFEF